MKLFHHFPEKQDDGMVMPVPVPLQKWIAPWANAVYTKYDFGYTLAQELATGKFSVYIWRFFIEKATRFYPACDKPTIALQFTLAGRITCELEGFGEKILEPSTCDFFYVPVSVNEAWFEPGRYESLHIELDPAYLEDMAEIYTDFKELMDRLHACSRQATTLVTVNTSYVMKAVLNNLRTCANTGAALKMEIQKYVLELLSEYIRETTEIKKEQALEYVPYKEKLIKIKQWIMEGPDIHAQTQENVSEKYGISLTALKLHFKMLFGIPLASFVRFHALGKAHYLISTTRQSIDDISMEVGYSNRTAFNQAFKKQFGCLPSAVRENMDDADQIQQK